MASIKEVSTVIAIDKDKNSKYAVKWAVDNLLMKNTSCTLIHVIRTKALHPRNVENASKQGRPPTNEELHQFFLPFRGFCARKGIVAKELVLHDIDVPSALTEYIIENNIRSIVVGAPNWNVFRRIFNDADVPSSLVRKSYKNGILRQSSDVIYFGQNNNAIQQGKAYISSEESNPPTLSDENNLSKLIDGSKLNENQDAVRNSNSSSSTNSSSKSPRTLETEINKLKLELKKTTEEYTKACREAVMAKVKAMDLEKFMFEEEQNIEKARLGEEAALALAEVEKQKTKAAIESAEMSRCLAAIEIKKRKQTEKRAMQKEEEKQIALNTNQPDNILCKRYNIKEIEDATNCFDKALKLGEGGYGPVFKGLLDNTVVAIKALRSNITQGDRQFQQEVDVLTTVRHPNMVLLLGVCPENGCLVYEFTENGTLEDRLFQKDNTPPLPWNLRFKIASEIATGLLFLHQTKPEPIVHRDLKPSNILLTKNYVTKIADVGLARLVPPSAADKTTQYHMTATAGTFFYIDPEYQQTGLLGVKSDIYSLGVVLLQIITGKGPMGVARLVEEAIHEGKFEEVLDPNVKDWPVEETLSLASLALKCCEMRKRDRPDLGSVILPELNRLSDLGGVLDTDIVTASRLVNISTSLNFNDLVL
ncbi:PREDICTED: U-box domain-containing protein 34-like [Lupinus angustifolius]|uniref:U-box domain-containing protein 34-like n=1 Tax=Lupinus angustifolius TaxID=3871 RepID=UPI00092EFBE7|nr:PREDICTED: U-box domain-containing protein 34-like [Lupinus angustifolius]